MAHPYTTRARVITRTNPRDTSAIADRNGDGAEDVGVFDGAIADACAMIDLHLGRRFVVPFDSTAGIAVDGTIASLADRLTIAFLLTHIDPPRHAEIITACTVEMRTIADGSGYINATERTVFTRKGGVRVLSGGTQIAGREDGDYTTPGGEKTYGI